MTRITGILAPNVVPFGDQGRIDEALTAQHRSSARFDLLFAGAVFPDDFRCGAAARGIRVGANRQDLAPSQLAETAALRQRLERP